MYTLTNVKRCSIKGKMIKETTSEKILGLIFSNDLTWKNQFYGEPDKPTKERAEGLMTALSKRLGIFRKVAKNVKKKTLRALALRTAES